MSGGVDLVVDFGGTAPVYSVALFLARGKATYIWDATGNKVLSARMRCSDRGHVDAYARAILRESPEGVTATVEEGR